jgi:hypothetical protein
VNTAVVGERLPFMWVTGFQIGLSCKRFRQEQRMKHL